ncbi:N-succinylarginine dihydrolase [Planctomicrobium piriforme]|uniref:N-succinylarginine dihydrolase n=1 Tax=Planctomicrobium piriforme TaxID=1576369 RepID=A0A1I3T464_9PLAN|nr:N-succinylarginine dihydrolase [Planctomicrobium piriforme]SFJ64641.1 succinylarginine dihydrolase [Planctomicrobium piriforme]
MNAFEVNFDGLVGPTHHYGGLAAGNLASQKNKQCVSHPRQAALEGLAKMKLLFDLGLKQAVLPPHPRPHLEFLRSSGLTGTDAELITQAAKTRPDLLSMAYSSAAMWTANAATVSPSMDTADGRVHLTPANLISTKHRSLEAEDTTKILRSIFRDTHSFVVYDPLPRHRLLADEGAANHTRLCKSYGKPGIELFVYGRDEEDHNAPAPHRYAARQTLQACERIASLHELPPARRLFIQQNPEAIDAGVFHNDVIAVGNENVLLCHELAFVEQRASLQKIRAAMDCEQIIEVRSSELSLAEAVSTYLFNSQLVTLPEGGGEGVTSSVVKQMLLLCPSECETHPRARAVIDRILAEPNPINQVRFIDVRQSMKNGGGPACLRLRVVLTELELSRLHGNVLLTEELYRQLCDWVTRQYREELSLADLGDPLLMEEVQTALTELEGILHLG